MRNGSAVALAAGQGASAARGAPGVVLERRGRRAVLHVEVALPLPVNHAFTYSVPDELRSRATAGSRVVCPVGSRRVVGVVLSVAEREPPRGVRPIADAVDEIPSIPEDLLAFLRDLASYYFAPIGEAVRLALPPLDRHVAQQVGAPSLFEEPGGLADRRVQWLVPAAIVEPPGILLGQAAAILAHVRAAGPEPVARLARRWGNARAAVRTLVELGVATVEDRAPPASPAFESPAVRDVPHVPTTSQQDAISAITSALESSKPATFVLHGVTGSGKTEVYLRALAVARERGKGSLMLVPEIALTPQLVARVRARFGDGVAVLHSALTPRERYAMWSRLRSGQVEVAVGARSALFAPVLNLGLVIVDEEHDSSFKQEEGVRYHGRDMAIWRAHRVSGVCVLGSATPALESEQLVRSGRAHKLLLPERAGARLLPHVELVDLRRIGPCPTAERRITMPLFRAMQEALAAREQVILFLNRRGFAPSIRCQACGKMITCSACSVALTLHKKGGDALRCHYCDLAMPLPEACPTCHAEALALEGLGTERLEESISAMFPSARVARLDRDVATGKRIEKVLARMRGGEIDILVGTQMVTKGHDLPNVTLVGVINADAALSIPDFRATERAFQLLVQVAGRAGRGSSPGRVIVQTWDPDNPAIAIAARHDVHGFMERELADRRELGYPPFARAALVRVDAADQGEALSACDALARRARECPPVVSGEVLVHGPAPAPIARIRGRWRYRLMLRARLRPALRETLTAIDETRRTLARTVRVAIDVDPVQLL
ncbi:MAG: primosomal protein N' [Polyangiaceae bacterium]